MTKEEFLKSVRKKIIYIFDRDSIENELKTHIEESILDLMEDGHTYEKAEQIAVEQMGDPDEIGIQLNKEHHPLIGYCLLASRVCLVCLVLPFIIVIGSIVYDGIKTMTSMTIEKYDHKITLNIEIENPTDKILIDNICIKDNEYYLTYRVYKNYKYSRTGGPNIYLDIYNNEEKYIGDARFEHSGFILGYGYIKFDLPENEIIYLKTREDKTIKVDLKEYLYE